MDDFAEMYTMPSWPDVNAMTKFPWDQNSGSAVNALGHSHFQPPDKEIPETLSSHQQTLLGILASSTHSSAMSSLSEIDSGSLISRHLHEAAAFAALKRMQEGCSQTSSSERIASSSSEIASSVINQMHAASPTWPQTYVEGMPFQHTPGMAGSKVQSFMQQEATQTPPYFCGRMQMDNATAGQNEGGIAPIYGHQAQQIRTSRQQVSHGISAAPYNSSNTGLGQQQGAAAAVVAGTTRPRVRARRGQATDPHSIAERLRRERIADRMKALQELVPNVNKTDKALMLDEIIEYVRFLQLQVKILNMSRLSGTGAIVPIMAELPSESLVDIATNALLKEGDVTCSSEDSLITIEGQVAKLMEESMGSALQFLQSKGLCLMPITLATAMSSGNTRQLTGSSEGKSNAASSPFRNSQSFVIPMTSVHTINDVFSSELCAAIRSSRESLSQPIAAASFPGALHMHN